MTERLHFHLSLSCIGEGNGNPRKCQLQCSCLENPRDGGAWWAAIYGVTQSRTRLKRLSSSSSKRFNIFNILNIFLKNPSHAHIDIYLISISQANFWNHPYLRYPFPLDPFISAYASTALLKQYLWWLPMSSTFLNPKTISYSSLCLLFRKHSSWNLSSFHLWNTFPWLSSFPSSSYLFGHHYL